MQPCRAWIQPHKQAKPQETLVVVSGPVSPERGVFCRSRQLYDPIMPGWHRAVGRSISVPGRTAEDPENTVEDRGRGPSISQGPPGERTEFLRGMRVDGRTLVWRMHLGLPYLIFGDVHFLYLKRVWRHMDVTYRQGTVTCKRKLTVHDESVTQSMKFTSMLQRPRSQCRFNTSHSTLYSLPLCARVKNKNMPCT